MVIVSYRVIIIDTHSQERIQKMAQSHDTLLLVRCMGGSHHIFATDMGVLKFSFPWNLTPHPRSRLG